MFEEIGRKLSGMVSIPTVSGKGNEKEYHIKEYREYLEKEFPNVFFRAHMIEVGEARLLRFVGKGREGLPVLFTGHMDVVPAGDTGLWEHPPFLGFTEKGIVWGRGAQDMKGPQCALLSALDQLLGEDWMPGREIWLYLSCDEEVGGDTTALAAGLLEKEGIRFETVYDEGGTICDNFMGMVEGRAAMFAIGEKGSLEYRFTALAQGGHSASPPKNSAIVRLGELMHEIEAGEIFRRELGKGNRLMLREMAACAKGETKEEKEKMREQLLLAAQESGEYPVLRKICTQADQLLGSTIAFTMIEGGSAFNVMPQKAVLTANVRIAASDSTGEITAILEALAQKHNLVCECVGGRGAVAESDIQKSGYQRMKDCVNEVYPGIPVIPFVLGGGTDSRHFAHLTEEIVRFSPMYAKPWQGRGVHNNNEAANIDAVRDAAMCYRCLLGKL